MTRDSVHEQGPMLSSASLNAYGDDNVDEPTIDLDKSTVEQRKRLWWRNAVINLAFIASWYFFATLLSVYNKWMFSPEHFGFVWPLFVTTFHMLVQFGLAAAVRVLWPSTFRPKYNPTRDDYGRKVVPTAVATSLDIGLSNLSLRAITLSFYTMCKSSSLIFVLFFAFLFNLEKFSYRLVGVILLIVIGVLLMVASETHFDLGGFILVMSGSALGGLRWSLTQLLLKDEKVGMDNPAATIYWLAPIMGATLATISLIVDGWFTILTSKFFENAGQILSTSFFLIAPGLIAFMMVMSEYYIIQRVGVVPMSIAGIAKEVTTISISAWFFGDILTPLNVVGVAITISGIALFTHHKYRKSIESQPSNGFRGEAGLESGYVPVQSEVELDVRETGEHGSSQQQQLNVRTSNEPDPVILFDADDDDSGIERTSANARNSITLHELRVDDHATDRPPAYYTVGS